MERDVSGEPLVLVIDDSRVEARQLEMILTRAGFRVLKANDGRQGRKIARSQRPDLILLDVNMPGESGFDTCRALKSDSSTASIPVIFVSGVDELDEKVRGVELGAADYITKPYVREDVLARSRLHIKLRQVHVYSADKDKARLQRLRKAQEAILTRPEERPEARFDVCYRSFNEAGGDFYDVIDIGKGFFGYLVADVSGHDLGTSLSTSALKALFNESVRYDRGPEETIRTINRAMSSVMTDGQFLTAAYASLNRTSLRLTVVGAGHPPVIYLPKEGAVRTIETAGDVLGVFPSITPDVCTLPVSGGDRFFLYTDGLIERFGVERKVPWRDGLEALKKACGDTRTMGMGAAIDDIIERMSATAGPPADDLVLMGVEV